MKTPLLILLTFIFCLSCKKSKPPITIVDIGHLDRAGIGKQLHIIKKYSPKIIGLDFLLVADSLEKDSMLVSAISGSHNVVQAATLYHYRESENQWDSIGLYHPKFRKPDYGFTNITVTDDRVFVRELPMRQYCNNQIVYAFSYVIANNAFGVKSKYKTNADNDFRFSRRSIGRRFKIITADEVLAETFNRNDVTNKIILMGYTGMTENAFYLDDSGTQKISGVEIHACIISEILN